MKKIFLTFCLLFLLFPKTTNAHMIGQPPYFKVDGVFTDFYPVPSTSLSDFDLPQDISKRNFLVNEKIDFEIDASTLPVPREVIDATKFTWDFGDGAKAEGLKNSHSYSKMGTYFMIIYADSQNGFEPQILQVTAINVLPNKDYKLPQSVISVNNQQTTDPLTDIKQIDLNKEVNFDASQSSGGDSEITQYIWDTGDINSSNEKSFKYTYKENPYIVFPLLRIKTKDGFIADSYLQITDNKNPPAISNSQNQSSYTKPLNQINWKTILITAILSGILTILIFTIFKKLRNNRRA